MYAGVMRSIRLEAGAFEALRAEVLGSPQARQQHRIHAVLLVAGGLSCRRAARLLGDSPRAVEYWIRRYNLNKINGLFDGHRRGRPSRLSAAQLAQLRAVVVVGPVDTGGGDWTGAAVSAFVARRWGVALGLRQAQRLLAKMRLDREISMRNNK